MYPRRRPFIVHHSSFITCRSGFTFIELITAITIICILAAILFPVFAKAQEKGRQCSCLTNLHNVGAALRMYAVEYHGHFPPANNDFAPLLPRWLPEPASLMCPTLYNPKRVIQYPPPLPEELAQARHPWGYVYRGGCADDDNPMAMVAADLYGDLHNDGANYLWVDGHGKWMRSYVPDGPVGPPSSQPSDEEIKLMDRLRTSATGKAYLNAPPSPLGDGGFI